MQDFTQTCSKSLHVCAEIISELKSFEIAISTPTPDFFWGSRKYLSSLNTLNALPKTSSLCTLSSQLDSVARIAEKEEVKMCIINFLHFGFSYD